MNVCRTCTIFFVSIFLNVVAEEEGFSQSSQGMTGYTLTKRESPPNYNSFGFPCKDNLDCDESMLCHQVVPNVQRCICRQGYFFYKDQCHFRHAPPPHLLHHPQIQNKPITTQQPFIAKPAHQGLFDTSCYVDEDCEQSMTCNKVQRKCECRPGFVPIGNHCIHIHELQFPGYSQYTPTRIHTKQIVSGNPILEEKPQRKQPLPSNTEDVPSHITYSVRKPAHGYGYACGSSTDCRSEHLHCHPTAKKCTCNFMFNLEGEDCVRHISIELKSSGSSFKQTVSVTSKINHGNTCQANSDCYHQGLVCDSYTFRCVCADKYYVDGDFCVMHDVSETPTIYVPDKPEHPNQRNPYNPRPVKAEQFAHPQQPNPPYVHRPNPPYVHRPNVYGTPREYQRPPVDYQSRPYEPNLYQHYRQ